MTKMRDGAQLGCTVTAPRPAHPRPTRRDVGTRQGRRKPRIRAASDRVVSRGKSRIGPTQADAAKIRPTRSVSAVSACIGRNGRVRPKFKKKEKKKKVQTHCLTNLKTQTPLRPSHFVQHSQTASLTPSLISLLCVLTVLRPSSLFSVFRALCECSVLLQPSGVLSLLFS